VKGGRPGEEERGRGAEGLPGYLRFLHLGWQMALILILGVFGGIWLDGRLGSGPAFTVVGSVLGIGLGMAVVIRETGKR